MTTLNLICAVEGSAYFSRCPFVNSPNPTVTSSNFGGTNLTTVSAFVIYADSNSPGLTVSYNTIDGAGAGRGSALIGAAGAGTTTLTYNWLKHFPQRVLAMTPQAPYSVVYKYNLIEQGAMEPGAHLNYLEFGTNGTSSSVDVEYNTSSGGWRRVPVLFLRHRASPECHLCVQRHDSRRTRHQAARANPPSFHVCSGPRRRISECRCSA